MIVYNDTKRQFITDVKDGDIEDKIKTCIRQKGLQELYRLKFPRQTPK